MRQVQIHGSKDARLDDVAEPHPGADDVVVKVAACGICGSDLKYIKLGGVAGPSDVPMPLGHEISGVIEFVGDNVSGTTVGDRVIVHPGDDNMGRIGNGGPEGALTTSLLVRGAAEGGRLFPIPEGMDLETAALAEPVGVGLNAANQADITEGSTVAIFGVGPIGLAAVMAAHARGAKDIVAIDRSPQRLDIAKKLGATHAVSADETDPFEILRERHGSVDHLFGPMAATDCFVEATGSEKVLRSLIDNARPAATIAVVALHYADIPTSFLSIMMKELTIRGAMEYPKRFTDAIDLLREVDATPMITHRFELEQWPDALETVLGEPSYGKIMVRC